MATVESRRESIDHDKIDGQDNSVDSVGAPTDGSTDDTMEDVSPPTTTSMGPPNNIAGGSSGDSSNNGTSAPSVGNAASQAQPKVVQTAFIHKLYKYVTPKADSLRTTNKSIACLKIKAYSISSRGHLRMKASLSLHQTSSAKCLRVTSNTPTYHHSCDS